MKGNIIKYAQDNIDTDVIIPGQYLKVHDYAELATHAMEGLDPDFHSKVKEGDFILSGKNFGCGSSREHASFARIFYRNSVDGAFLLPIEIDEDAYNGISEGDEIDIDISTNEIKNITKNQTYKMKPFSEIIGKIISAGGLFKYNPDQN
jgi:3-isopropylmalate/(R)-2-methylmalate dehydratase small subunit